MLLTPEELHQATIRAHEHNIATGRVLTIYPIESLYEPIPFHRPLTLGDVRTFFETGCMPMDKPGDEEEAPALDDATWLEGTDVSQISQCLHVIADDIVIPGRRLRSSNPLRYNPSLRPRSMSCVRRRTAMQVPEIRNGTRCAREM